MDHHSRLPWTAHSPSLILGGSIVFLCVPPLCNVIREPPRLAPLRPPLLSQVAGTCWAARLRPPSCGKSGGAERVVGELALRTAYLYAPALSQPCRPRRAGAARPDPWPPQPHNLDEFIERYILTFGGRWFGTATVSWECGITPRSRRADSHACQKSARLA